MNPGLIQYTLFDTTWGVAGLAATPAGLYRCTLPQEDSAVAKTTLQVGFPQTQYQKSMFPGLISAIQAYFKGQILTFDSQIPLDLSTRSHFSQAVLHACRKIPPGQTRTYGELAQQAGSPQAARAVGGAMARNPLPLIIPCHRVIASTGRLTGFSAPGGLALKKRMLDHEHRYRPKI